MPLRPLRDVDTAGRTRWLRAFGWAVFPGFFIGLAVAARVADTWGVWGFVVVPVALTLVVGGAALAFSEGVGAAFGALAHPRGGAVPPDYSRVEALRLRGDLDGAVAALEDEVGRHPGDPEPSLRLARLLRDDADRPDEALAWFRAARAAERIRPARAAAVGREIVELLEKQGDLPAALTELARLADLHEGCPTGRWADDERRRLKALWLEGTES